MPASMRTSTPSGAGGLVSTVSKRRSLWACSRQALWVLVIANSKLGVVPAEEPGRRARLRDCNANWLLGNVGVIALDFLRQLDQHAAARDIYRRNHRIGERQQHGCAAMWRDFQNIAGAE